MYVSSVGRAHTLHMRMRGIYVKRLRGMCTLCPLSEIEGSIVLAQTATEEIGLLLFPETKDNFWSDIKLLHRSSKSSKFHALPTHTSLCPSLNSAVLSFGVCMHICVRACLFVRHAFLAYFCACTLFAHVVGPYNTCIYIARRRSSQPRSLPSFLVLPVKPAYA